jgi:hypothetical protein
LKPVQYFEMMKYGRQATAGLSEKFITRVGPTMAQEMGGQSFGQAVASFNRAIVGGHMAHDALKQLASVGLIKPEDLERTKTGSIKGLIPGHHIQGYKLAQENPYEWVQKVLLPALKEHGITKKEDILAMTAQLFSKGTAAQLVDMFATQSQRIEKDMALLEKAQGAAEAARTLQQKDPGTQLTAAKNVVGDLAGTLGADLFTNTGALNAVTDKLGALNERLANSAPGSIFWQPGAGYGGAKEQVSFLDSAALGLDKAKTGTEAPRRVLAGTSWSHPLEKFEAQRVLGNAMQKELEAKEKFEAARPIGPISPGILGSGTLFPRQGVPSGALSPFSMENAAHELKGEATIKNSLSISLDPGLIAKEVKNQLTAGGNLRGDTGVSMSPSSILPR